jgi:hypothetical protein
MDFANDIFALAKICPRHFDPIIVLRERLHRHQYSNIATKNGVNVSVDFTFLVALFFMLLSQLRRSCRQFLIGLAASKAEGNCRYDE